ncbi:hypothetical protein [Anaerotignum sp.]|uniref:hypothetical protein n=1 Tax=Anaerotignum sp. TaxID=2039241 RepID=UPI00289D2D3B|nr:hypothetical protein [Anaerotignum sp.]
MARSVEAQPPRPSALENMTRAKAEVYGLKVGARVRQYITSYDDSHKSKCKVREGTVIGIWDHGFAVQLPNHKTFFRYNLLRRQEQGERVEILKG